MDWLRGRREQKAELEGVVVLALLAAGSKSEREGPALLLPDGRHVQVHVVDDTPFEEPTLRGLVGVHVRVKGKWRNGTLRVVPGAVERLESP